MKAEEKMELKTLVGSAEALGVLSNCALPASVSFRLKRLLKTVNENLADYDKTRTELCRKFGTLNEAGDKFEFEGEKAKEFQAEFDELLGSEIELSFEQIKAFDLRDASISANVLLQLDWLIVE